MRKIRDVLRLTHALGMSRRLVGEATGIGKTAVGDPGTLGEQTSLSMCQTCDMDAPVFDDTG